MKKNIIIKYIITNILLLVIIYLLYHFQKRICLIYNLFRIPCPGCGLTRSVNYLIHGDIKMSLKYNIITIPLSIVYSVYLIWYLIDIIRNKDSLIIFIKKNKKIILVIVVIIVVISELINLNNPLLYK